MPTLTEIWFYPVKSARGLRLRRAEIGRRGILFDRHWMVVDGDGRFLTQRQLAAMALIAPTLGDDELLLEAPGMPPLRLPVQAQGARLDVQVWQDRVAADVVTADANDWLCEFLGVPCQLVAMAEDVRRVVDPNYAAALDETGFSDGFPLLLIGEGSRADLNSRLVKPLPMRRFRPNLVVADAPAFAEDRWRRLRIGNVTFRVVKPCSRCVITTVDPDRGERDGQEPLRTLMTFRRRDSKVYFGQNLLHDGPGEIAEGMTVEVLEEGEPRP